MPKTNSNYMYQWKFLNKGEKLAIWFSSNGNWISSSFQYDWLFSNISEKTTSDCHFSDETSPYTNSLQTGTLMKLLRNTYIFLKAANLWYDVDMKIIKHTLKAVLRPNEKPKSIPWTFLAKNDTPKVYQRANFETPKNSDPTITLPVESPPWGYISEK